MRFSFPSPSLLPFFFFNEGEVKPPPLFFAGAPAPQICLSRLPPAPLGDGFFFFFFFFVSPSVVQGCLFPPLPFSGRCPFFLFLSSLVEGASFVWVVPVPLPPLFFSLIKELRASFFFFSFFLLLSFREDRGLFLYPFSFFLLFFFLTPRERTLLPSFPPSRCSN